MRTISLAIALLMVGAGLFIVGEWLVFGGVLRKDSVAIAAFLIAGGLAIAFVREWWMKR